MLWSLPQATLSLTELSEVICKERAQKAAWFLFPNVASVPTQKAELFTFLSAFTKGRCVLCAINISKGELINRDRKQKNQKQKTHPKPRRRLISQAVHCSEGEKSKNGSSCWGPQAGKEEGKLIAHPCGTLALCTTLSCVLSMC